MKIGLSLNYSGGFKEAVDHVVELEKVGADIVLVAEAYSYDAVSQLGYLAAKTNTIELGSGVFPIYTRTPSLLAMTAAGLTTCPTADSSWASARPGRKSSRDSTVSRSTRRWAAPAK